MDPTTIKSFDYAEYNTSAFAMYNEFLGEINVIRIEETEEAIVLTNKYMEYGVLKEKTGMIAAISLWLP